MSLLEYLGCKEYDLLLTVQGRFNHENNYGNNNEFNNKIIFAIIHVPENAQKCLLYQTNM